MVRPPSFDSNGMKSGAWNEDEDNKLRAFIHRNGHPNWRLLPSSAGLKRCGKSCRLRWVNYLQPGLIKGNFSKEEEDIIIKLHKQHGNKWSFIADKLPGRTDNDVKNHWHAHIKKKRSSVICAEIGKSSDIKKPIHQKETATLDAPSSSGDQSREIANAINGHDAFLLAQADQVYDLPPFTGEGFPDFGLCHNDTPTFSNSSCFSQLKIDVPEDEFFEFGLCPNDMSTLGDSSKGGITSRSDSSVDESDGSFWSEYVYEDDIVDMVLWQ